MKDSLAARGGCTRSAPHHALLTLSDLELKGGPARRVMQGLGPVCTAEGWFQETALGRVGGMKSCVRTKEFKSQSIPMCALPPPQVTLPGALSRGRRGAQGSAP